MPNVLVKGTLKANGVSIVAILFPKSSCFPRELMGCAVELREAAKAISHGVKLFWEESFYVSNKINTNSRSIFSIPTVY